MPDSPLELGELLWFLPLAFLIGAFSIGRLWQRSRLLGVIAIILVVVGCAVLTYVKSISPEGTYSCINFERPCPNQDCLWRLSHGKVLNFECGEINLYGSYRKTQDGWSVTHEIENPFVWRLKFSVLGFRFSNNEVGDTAYSPRRVLPFLLPFRLPDALISFLAWVLTFCLAGYRFSLRVNRKQTLDGMSPLTRVGLWLLPWLPILAIGLFVWDRYFRSDATHHFTPIPFLDQVITLLSASAVAFTSGVILVLLSFVRRIAKLR